MISRFARNAIVLGLLSAVGPFAIDMYLPALPTIAADLHASTAATQMTLTAFFLTFGLCQLVYGPWSDAVGRKVPLTAGVGLFALGTVGCGLSATVGWLIAFRVVQGMGAAAVVVIPRAIIRDLHTGHEATRLMALVMLVFSVSPILAPLVGSALIVPFGWRAVFAAVTVAALVGLALIATVLPETRLPADRVPARPAAILGGFGRLLRHASFLGLTFTGGLGLASFFVFLSTSSFVYIDHFGLTPTQYSLAFSINAVGFIGSSQFAARLGLRFGLARMVVTATSLYALFAMILLGVVLLGVDNFVVLVTLLFLTFACLGLVIPTTAVLALEEHGAIAGLAAALGGTLQLVLGGVVIALASASFDGTSRPMVALIALCAAGALATSVATLARVRRPVPERIAP